MLTDNSAMEQINVEGLTLTPAAAQAISDMMQKRNLEGYALRVFVQGGGCSGFQYGMALDNNIRAADNRFTLHDVQVIVDEVSIDYLRGATVDFEDNLMGGGFKIENPNAVSSCGCGSSFRSKDSSADASGGGCSGCG